MQAFTTSHKDPLTSAAAGILFNEDLSSVQDKVKGLRVGDVTNFGTVKTISDTSIEFKARDTGVTKISFNQRKMGSKDFVLDKLVKITKEETELDEAKAADPANLRSIIANHTALLSKATEPEAKTFHKTAIANAKEKLKSLGEEVELEEGINFTAVAAAKKAGMSDAAIDSYVKIHKANGATDKEISAALMSGKAMKKEGSCEDDEEDTIEEGASVIKEQGPKYKTKSPAVKKITDQFERLNGAETLDFWKSLQQYAWDLSGEEDEDSTESWGIISSHLVKIIKEYQLHLQSA